MTETMPTDNYLVNFLLNRVAEAMKYLINVHLLGGEIRTDIFLDSIEEIEKYIIKLKQELTPKKVVMCDADTKETLKIVKTWDNALYAQRTFDQHIRCPLYFRPFQATFVAKCATTACPER